MAWRHGVCSWLSKRHQRKQQSGRGQARARCGRGGRDDTCPDLLIPSTEQYNILYGIVAYSFVLSEITGITTEIISFLQRIATDLPRVVYRVSGL